VYSKSVPHQPYPEQHCVPGQRAPAKSAPQRPAVWRVSKWWRKREKRFGVVAFRTSTACGAESRSSRFVARFESNSAFSTGFDEAKAPDELKAPARMNVVHLILESGNWRLADEGNAKPGTARQL